MPLAATIPTANRSMTMLAEYIYGEGTPLPDDASLHQFSLDAYATGDFTSSAIEKLNETPDRISEFKLSESYTEEDYSIDLLDVSVGNYNSGANLLILFEENLNRSALFDTVNTWINEEPSIYSRSFTLDTNGNYTTYDTTLVNRFNLKMTSRAVDGSSRVGLTEYVTGTCIVDCYKNGVLFNTVSTNFDTRTSGEPGFYYEVLDDDKGDNYAQTRFYIVLDDIELTGLTHTDVITITYTYVLDLSKIQKIEWYFDVPYSFADSWKTFELSCGLTSSPNNTSFYNVLDELQETLAYPRYNHTRETPEYDLSISVINDSYDVYGAYSIDRGGDDFNNRGADFNRAINIRQANVGLIDPITIYYQNKDGIIT